LQKTEERSEENDRQWKFQSNIAAQGLKATKSYSWTVETKTGSAAVMWETTAGKAGEEKTMRRPDETEHEFKKNRTPAQGTPAKNSLGGHLQRSRGSETGSGPRCA